MAWLDDRIWCHPKFTGCSKPARWSYVAGVCYSTGFQTRGFLTVGQLRTIGVVARERRELVAAGLWDELPDGSVQVHDWDEHNSRRDERRAADRERKSRQRERDRSRVTSAVTARVEGSEGSESKSSRPGVLEEEIEEPIEEPFSQARSAGEMLLLAIRPSFHDAGTRTVVLSLVDEIGEAAARQVLAELKRVQRDGSVRNDAKWVVGALQKRARARMAAA